MNERGVVGSEDHQNKECSIRLTLDLRIFVNHFIPSKWGMIIVRSDLQRMKEKKNTENREDSGNSKDDSGPRR